MSERLLGLDFGNKTVGVAVSDALGITAQGVEIIRREKPTKLRKTYARIVELIGEYEVGKIVIGLPVELDGTEGERCRVTREFADGLATRTDLPMEFQDERYTTVISDRTMNETGQSDHKKYVDEIAAMLILQSYMDREKNISNGK